MDVIDQENQPAVKTETSKRKTRRGLARRNVNIENVKEDLENFPSSDVYALQVNEILQSQKQCETKAKEASEILFREEAAKELILEQQKNTRKLTDTKQTIIKSSGVVEIEDEDLALLSCSPPPSSLNPEVLYLLNDLEMTKAALEAAKTVEEEAETDDCDRSLLQKQEILLRIFCRGQCHRLNLVEDEPFLKVMNEIARIHQVKPTQLSLYFQDNLIKNDDTPQSINLDIAHIIECYIMDEKDDDISNNVQETNSNSINLKIQTKDTKVKVTVQINKTDCMSVMMDKFAGMMNFPVDRLTFRFDGDAILPSDVAEDLGLEDNYCIDVAVKL